MATTATIAAFAADLPCRVLLSRVQAEQVLGNKGDEGLRRLRMDSGANIQMIREQLLPAAFRARDEFLVVILADDGVRLRKALAGVLGRAFDRSRPTGDTRDAGEEEVRRGIVEVMIPEVACRHLVGARGDRIKLLREEAGCDIQLSPGDVAGVAAQKRVRCNGAIANLGEAVARIHQVLAEFAAIGILALRHFDLQEVGNTLPNLSPAGSLNGLGPGEASAGLSRSAITTASATAKNCRLALRLLVSKDECGWLIGRRGNKIHKLRELAMVSTRDADPDVTPGSPSSVVDIFGTPLAKCLCVLQLIVDDLELLREALPGTRLLLPAADLSSQGELWRRLEEIASAGAPGGSLQQRAGTPWCVLELLGSARERLAGAGAAHELLEMAAPDREAASLATSAALVQVQEPARVLEQRGQQEQQQQQQPQYQQQQQQHQQQQQQHQQQQQQRGQQEPAQGQQLPHGQLDQDHSHEKQQQEQEQQRQQQERQQQQQQQQQQQEQQQQQQQERQQERQQQQHEQHHLQQQQRQQQQQQERQQQEQEQQQQQQQQKDRQQQQQQEQKQQQHQQQQQQQQQEQHQQHQQDQRQLQHQQHTHNQQHLQQQTFCDSLPGLGTAELWLQLSSYAVALRLARGCRIEERAGVVLTVERQDKRSCTDSGGALLRVSGTPMANAVACFLVQKALWLDSDLGSEAA